MLKRAEPENDILIIDVTDNDIFEIAKQTWGALDKKNQPPYIFKYANTIVRLITDSSHEAVIDVLDKKKMRYELVRCAKFFQILQNGVFRFVIPPGYLIDDMLSDPSPPVPDLTEVISTPVFASNGSLNCEPGYDPDTSSYLSIDPCLNLPVLPDKPSEQDVIYAKKWVDEMLGDFPFTNPSEYSHAVALFLGSFARNLINGQFPITVIEASAPGTGKTLLAQAITCAVTGKPIEAMCEGSSEQEMRKRLTAKLMRSPVYVLIDNVRDEVAYSSLASVVTSGIWEDRLLGASKTVQLPVNCLWIITGNNPSLSAEIARRSVRICLDTGRERPWLRRSDQFKHPDLIGWIKANRGQLIWSALVLIKHWFAQGGPPLKTAKTLGMFEEWCSVIGGILETNGIPGFLENLESLYSASDMETATWRFFTQCWWQTYEKTPVGVAQLHKLVLQNEIDIDIGSGNIRSQRIKLGLRISNMRHRTFGNYRIIPDKQRNHAQTWQLERLGQNYVA